MPKQIERPELSEEEQKQLEKLRRSRVASRREVERAEILLSVVAGERVEKIAERVRRSPATIYHQVKQFQARGMDFLADEPRSGRPPTYTSEQQGQMVLTAKTHPSQLGQSFGYWTLNRLLAYVHEALDIPISRSQLAALLTAEGVRWYQEKTYFTESPDPQFVEKRGQL